MKTGIFLTFGTFLYVTSCEEYRENSFGTIDGCRVDFKLTAIPVSTDVVRGRIQCAIMCAKDQACISVNACPNPSGGYLCERLDSSSNGLCSGLQRAPGCVHLQLINPCLNGGVFNYPLMKCDCPDDFTGTYCERRYRDCSEAYVGGTRGSGSSYRELYIRPINSPSEHLVECYLNYGGWTTLEIHGVNCVYDYNRTWEEYKAGWITPCLRWLGLEGLHYLTNQPDTTCNLDCFISINNGETGQFYYSGFTIGNEESNYTLSYVSQWKHGTKAVGDGFAFGGSTKSINGKDFSTSDRPDPQGCAVSAGAGWWYGDQCPDTNLHKTLSSDSAATNVAEWPDENGNIHKVIYLRLQIKVLPVP